MVFKPKKYGGSWRIFPETSSGEKCSAFWRMVWTTEYIRPFLHPLYDYLVQLPNKGLTSWNRSNLLIKTHTDLESWSDHVWLVTATTTLFHMDQTLVALPAPKRKRRKKRTALREYMRMFISVYMYIYMYTQYIFICVNVHLCLRYMCFSMYFFICVCNYLSIHECL